MSLRIRARHGRSFFLLLFFFFNDTATTEIYTSIDTLSLHDALPISPRSSDSRSPGHPYSAHCRRSEEHTSELQSPIDISYAVFCLKKKKNNREKDYFAVRVALQTKRWS